MSGVAPSRAVAGSSAAGTPAMPTRSSFLPWAEDPAGPPRHAKTITHADSTAETRIDIVIRGTHCRCQPFRVRRERARGPVWNLLSSRRGCDAIAEVGGARDRWTKPGESEAENASEGPDNLDFLFHRRLYSCSHGSARAQAAREEGSREKGWAMKEFDKKSSPGREGFS